MHSWWMHFWLMVISTKPFLHLIWALVIFCLWVYTDYSSTTSTSTINSSMCIAEEVRNVTLKKYTRKRLACPPLFLAECKKKFSSCETKSWLHKKNIIFGCVWRYSHTHQFPTPNFFILFYLKYKLLLVYSNSLVAIHWDAAPPQNVRNSRYY